MQEEAKAAPEFADWLARHPLPSEVVEFSRTDGIDRKLARVRICVLHMNALDLARTRAFKRLTSPGRFKPAELRQPIPAAIQQDAVAREVLVDACCTVNPIPQPVHLEGSTPVYARTFRDPDHMSKLVGEEDLKWLWAQYLRISGQAAPVFVDEEGDEPEEETEDASAD